MRLKVGIGMIEVVAIFCPYCGEAWGGTESGSQMVTSEDRVKAGQRLYCFACRVEFKAPKLVGRIGSTA